MDIKWIFHGLAILSGIIASTCALLSSQNKISLFVCFSLIAAIFELTIPFLKIRKTVPPEVVIHGALPVHPIKKRPDLQIHEDLPIPEEQGLYFGLAFLKSCSHDS